MDVCNNDEDSILQTQIKSLYNILTARFNYQLVKSHAYLDDQDFSQAHDCIIKANIYKEIVDVLEPLTMI